MEHLVRFMTAEGREGTHNAASLDDALQFVERLRNTEGANEVQLFRMHEVPIEFKTYYRVEVRAGEEPPNGYGGPSQSGGSGSGAAGPPPPSAVDGDTDTNGRRLFSRS